MVTKVQRWGNSQGLRLARKVLEDARIEVGEEVEVSVREGMIVIVPARRVRGRVKLDQLLAGLPGDYKASEVDWGGPAGKEVW